MTVHTLLSTISSRELGEWMALYKLEYKESQQDPEKVLAQRAKAKLDARSRKR